MARRTRRTLPVPRYRKDRGTWEVDTRRLGGGRRQFASEADAVAYCAQLGQRPALARVDRTTTLRDYGRGVLERIGPELAPATARSYRALFERHVVPHLGPWPVADITVNDIKALLALKQGEGLGTNTVRLVRATLSVILSEAVDDGLLPANPAFGLGRRRRGRAAAAGAEKIRAMTAEQLARFVAAAEALVRTPTPPWAIVRDATLAVYLVTLGPRPGEAQAQRPEDLDLRAGTVRVERSWSLGGAGAKTTKTAETRTPELSREFAERWLPRWLARLHAEALRRGWGRPQWLFPNELGRPLEIGRVQDIVARLCRRAGLPRFTPYDLRHSYICVMLERGAPATWVAAQVGNSVETLYRFYARWIPGARRSGYADLIDAPGAGGMPSQWANLIDAPRAIPPPNRHQSGASNAGRDG